MAMTGFPFYSPFRRVGFGEQNGRADVMLVQYMLWYVMIAPANAQWRSTIPPTMPDGGSPNVLFPFTGLFTPPMTEWIKHFQKQTGPQLGFTLKVDGAINPLPQYWGNSKGLQRNYTIQALNLGMCHANRDLFMHMWDASDIPPTLKTDLTMVRLAAFG